MVVTRKKGEGRNDALVGFRTYNASRGFGTSLPIGETEIDEDVVVVLVVDREVVVVGAAEITP